MTATYAPTLMRTGTTFSRLHFIPRSFAASEFTYAIAQQRERGIARERRVTPKRV